MRDFNPSHKELNQIFNHYGKQFMGLLNFFSKKASPLDNYLCLIQSQILDTNEFRSFKSLSESYEDELNEFKRFIVVFISGCLYLLKVKQHLEIDEFQNSDPIYRKIFQAIYRQLIPFYKSYVQTDKIIIGLSSNNRLEDNKMVLLDTVVRLKEYEREIRLGLETGNSYFFDEFETQEYDEEFGMLITGRKIYFEYVRLLLLSKLEKNDENKLQVKKFEAWQVDSEKIGYLSSFVKSLSEIQQNIKVTPEMLG